VRRRLPRSGSVARSGSDGAAKEWALRAAKKIREEPGEAKNNLVHQGSQQGVGGVDGTRT
jgi:hypothetical protein